MVVGAILALTACDPAKLIVLKNKTDNPAHFRWTVRIDSSCKNEIYQFKTVTFDLGTSKTDRETTIVFGFGNWPTREVERLVDEKIQSIEIESVNEKITMTNNSKIKNYLLARRRGILRNSITIKLE